MQRRIIELLERMDDRDCARQFIKALVVQLKKTESIITDYEDICEPTKRKMSDSEKLKWIEYITEEIKEIE